MSRVAVICYRIGMRRAVAKLQLSIELVLTKSIALKLTLNFNLFNYYKHKKDNTI